MFISNSSMNKLTAIYRTVTLYYKIELDTVLKLRQFIHSINIQYLESYLTLSFYEHIILLDEWWLTIYFKDSYRFWIADGYDGLNKLKNEIFI